MRPARPLATAAAAVGLLALAGCSSGEEPPVLGADGSGRFQQDPKVSAALAPVDDGASAGTARATSDGDGSRIVVRLRAVAQGTWTPVLLPGSRCSDDLVGDVSGAEGALTLPDLDVDESGRALLDTTVEVPLSDLAGGAALRLDGPNGTTCGTLADH